MGGGLLSVWNLLAYVSLMKRSESSSVKMLRGQSWALLEKVYAGNTWFEGSRFWNPSMQKEYEKKTKLFLSLELIPTSSSLQLLSPQGYLLFAPLVFLSLHSRCRFFTYLFASRWVGRVVPTPAKARKLWSYLISILASCPFLSWNIFFPSQQFRNVLLHEEG